jgi:hypothetical protein
MQIFAIAMELQPSGHRGHRATTERSPLYVQLPKSEAEKLDRAAFELKAYKRDLVAALVAHYVDPTTREGLARLRDLGAPSRNEGQEVPLPPRPDERREPLEPTVRIRRASEWVSGMQRAIREFADARQCAEPFVRVTLDDGEQLFLEGMRAGPDDDFVTFSVHDPADEITRLVVLRLDTIRQVEMLCKAPSAREKTFVFHPRTIRVGFTSTS